MDYGDPQQWKDAASALGYFSDAVKKVIGLFKEARSQHQGTESQALDAAVAEIENAAGVVHAKLAAALGYELCRCAFPPTPILTVGYMARHRTNMGEPVHECPKCRRTTAGPFSFQRTQALADG